MDTVRHRRIFSSCFPKWIFITKFITFPCILTSEFWSRRKRHLAIKPCHINSAGLKQSLIVETWSPKKRSGNKGGGTKQRHKSWLEWWMDVRSGLEGKPAKFKSDLFLKFYEHLILIEYCTKMHLHAKHSATDWIRAWQTTSKRQNHIHQSLYANRPSRLCPRPREWLGDLVSEKFRSLPQIMGPVFKILSSLLPPLWLTHNYPLFLNWTFTLC